MKAQLRFHQKVVLFTPGGRRSAVAELKVWDVPVSEHYPEGMKYSLFLVEQQTGEVLVGFDNHKPKGPHVHIGGEEIDYEFQGTDQLIEDFWELARKEGFTDEG